MQTVNKQIRNLWIITFFIYFLFNLFCLANLEEKHQREKEVNDFIKNGNYAIEFIEPTELLGYFRSVLLFYVPIPATL